MGYDVIYENGFKLNKKLSRAMAKFLAEFSETRHYRRNISGYGLEGEYFLDTYDKLSKDAWDEIRLTPNVDAKQLMFEKYNIIDYNTPPATQPGLWCQWVPSKDKTQIEWNGYEKFYHGPEWMQYIIDNFLLPNGYSILDGSSRMIDEGIMDYDEFPEDPDDDFKNKWYEWYDEKQNKWFNRIMYIKNNKVTVENRT